MSAFDDLDDVPLAELIQGPDQEAVFNVSLNDMFNLETFLTNLT